MSWRFMALSSVVGLAIDGCIAYVLAYFAAPNDKTAFWIYWAVIICLSLLFSLLAFAKRWVFFFIHGKERATREFLKLYHQSKFPHPEGEYDIDRYILNIIGSTETPDKTKISAASLGGQMIMARSLHGLSIGAMMSIASENAIQRYHQKTHVFDIGLNENFYKGDQ